MLLVYYRNGSRMNVLDYYLLIIHHRNAKHFCRNGVHNLVVPNSCSRLGKGIS